MWGRQKHAEIQQKQISSITKSHKISVSNSNVKNLVDQSQLRFGSKVMAFFNPDSYFYVAVHLSKWRSI
jgi:hypothetical protein